MKSTILLVCIVVVVGLLAGSVSQGQAQTGDAPAWEVVVFQQNTLYSITSDGIEEFVTDCPLANSVYRSFDNHTAVFVDHDAGTFSVFDFETRTCILTSTIPDLEVDLSWSGLSPDGTRFAYGYRAENIATNEMVNRIVIIDVASKGEQSFDIPAVDLADRVFMGPWTDEGIYFYMNCNTCAMMLADSYQRLDPDTGTITDTERMLSIGADVLDLTGEMVVSATNPDYLQPSYLEGVFLDDPRNVLEYRPAGSWSDQPVVIYHNPNDLDHWPNWVFDGNAILTENANHTPRGLIHRDGSVSEIVVPLQAKFVSGTLDGWVMQVGVVEFVYYHEVDGELEVTSLFLGEMSSEEDLASFSPVTLLWRTPLGATVESGSFAAADLDAYLMSNCDTVDYWFDWGDSVPGPVTVYEAPDNESEILAEIDTEVTILNGPICPSRVSAWWRVETDDERRGWINETSPRSTERCPRDPRRNCVPIGEMSRQGSTLELYNEPGGALISTLPAGQPFMSIGGPVCIGETDTWLQVQTDEGIIGWVNEVCGMG